jgi:hypothetical protein
MLDTAGGTQMDNKKASNSTADDDMVAQLIAQGLLFDTGATKIVNGKPQKVYAKHPALRGNLVLVSRKRT